MTCGFKDARRAPMHPEQGVQFSRDEMSVTIQDDGIGPDVPENRNPFARAQHFGLMSMQERATLLEACLEIASERNQGTQIKIRVPLASA